MAEKKITKREHFEGIMNFLAENGKSEWAEVIAHEIELLDNKKLKSGKPTAKQMENAAIGEIIKDILAEHDGVTITQLMKDDRLAKSAYELTSQRVTAIVGALVKSNEVSRTVEKKVPYFRLIYGTVEG